MATMPPTPLHRVYRAQILCCGRRLYSYFMLDPVMNGKGWIHGYDLGDEVL